MLYQESRTGFREYDPGLYKTAGAGLSRLQADLVDASHKVARNQ